MNWKLIFQLSLFGLAMAIGTIYFIPSSVEPFFWLAIFLLCAYLIANKAPGKFFLHGFLVSLVNCVWVTAAHVILYKAYAAGHIAEIDQMRGIIASLSPRKTMLVIGPVIGILSGLVLGLFSFIASKIFRRKKHIHNH